jgi:quinol monooxygenase YgiN
MVKQVCVMILAFTITGTWIGTSAAQPPATGQVLRVVTAMAKPDQREHISMIIDEIYQVYAAAKGMQWSTIGYDPATGEAVAVTLWDSQADADAFMKSEALKAVTEKIRPLATGNPTIKTYHVYGPKP